MKVVYTSDIHIDVTDNNRLLLPVLARRAAQMRPDVFVLAGDVANALPDLDNGLAHFAELPCPKVLAPGNHDIWVSKNQAAKGRDSYHKYGMQISESAARHGFVYPLASPYIIGDLAVVASLGWYDYSLQDPRLSAVYSTADYDGGTFGPAVWNDVANAIWLRYPDATDWRRKRMKLRNPEVCAKLLGEFRSAVLAVPVTAKRLLLVVHTAPFKECITRADQASPFDAYQGSTAFGEVMDQVAADRPVDVICGHTHQPLGLVRGNIRVFRSPVGYLDQTPVDLDIVAQRALGEFEV